MMFSGKSEVVLKSSSVLISIVALAVSTVCSVSAEELTLEATKDSFFRANNKSRNNGASPQLLLFETPISRSVISFDFSGVTNEIESAELQFRQGNTIRDRYALSFTVAPMVSTTNNAAWVEGNGNVALKGNPAKVGESTFLKSSFSKNDWEYAPGRGVFSLADDKLWEQPIAQLKDVVWTEGNWVTIRVDAAQLETVRNSDLPVYTVGIWGTSGKGLYYISSKESGFSPKLVLQLKEEPEEEK